MDAAKVLVVDDDPNLVDLCAQVLEAAGYEVDVAGDGGEALEKLYSNQFGAVLLDVMMPVIDGITVCERAKNDPRTREVPIIIMSASPAWLERGRECADAVIAKPFSIDHLIEAIGQFV